MKDGVMARYFRKIDDDMILCELCPHHCKVPEGKHGICGVRYNRQGTLIAEGYGVYPAIHLDPIEKKPLNHFLPGSTILSLGSVGCNLTCRHCQNWSLARSKVHGNDILTIDELLLRAKEKGSIGVAFTYNEPTINFEYIMDAGKRLRENGSKVVLVTNGYLEKDPWNDLMGIADAANIDVKGFTDEFYADITGGSLGPVLGNVETAFNRGVHIEIAYLVIPGLNDDERQISEFLDWTHGSLSSEVPIHFNRFHPDHRMMDVPPTPPETLMRIRDMAKEKGSKNIFIGNITRMGWNDTFCSFCGKKLISRDGFWAPKMKDGRCRSCKNEIYGVWR